MMERPKTGTTRCPPAGKLSSYILNELAGVSGKKNAITTTTKTVGKSSRGHVTAEQVTNVQAILFNHLRSEPDAPRSPARRIVSKLLQHYAYLQSPRRPQRTAQTPPPSPNPTLRKLPPSPFPRTSTDSSAITCQVITVAGEVPPARSPGRKARSAKLGKTRPQSAPQPHPYPVHPSLGQQSHASSTSLLHSPSRSPTRVRAARASRPKEGQSSLMRQWANVGVRESKEKKMQQELEVLSALADEKMIRSDDALLGGGL